MSNFKVGDLVEIKQPQGGFSWGLAILLSNEPRNGREDQVSIHPLNWNVWLVNSPRYYNTDFLLFNESYIFKIECAD